MRSRCSGTMSVVLSTARLGFCGPGQPAARSWVGWGLQRTCPSLPVCGCVTCTCGYLAWEMRVVKPTFLTPRILCTPYPSFIQQMLITPWRMAWLWGGLG